MRASLKLLDALVEAGLNFIDTADVYSRWVPGHSGESETIIGNWMKARGNRDQVIIATKVGSEMDRTRRDCPRPISAPPSTHRSGGGPTASISINPIGTISTPSQAETLSVYADLINEGRSAPSALRTSPRHGSRRPWTRAPGWGCPDTRASSPSTISTTGRNSRANWSRSAGERDQRDPLLWPR